MISPWTRPRTYVVANQHWRRFRLLDASLVQWSRNPMTTTTEMQHQLGGSNVNCAGQFAQSSMR